MTDRFFFGPKATATAFQGTQLDNRLERNKKQEKFFSFFHRNFQGNSPDALQVRVNISYFYKIILDFCFSWLFFTDSNPWDENHHFELTTIWEEFFGTFSKHLTDKSKLGYCQGLFGIIRITFLGNY